MNYTTYDLKPGYVVKLGGNKRFYMVMESFNGAKIIVNKAGEWEFLSSWSEDFKINPMRLSGNNALGEKDDIVEIYGFVQGDYGNSFNISDHERECLYREEKAVKMTVKEIEDKLGYKIEIVSNKTYY